jgi:hypothetical protein
MKPRPVKVTTQNNPPRESNSMKRIIGIRKIPASEGAAVFRPGTSFAMSRE